MGLSDNAEMSYGQGVKAQARPDTRRRRNVQTTGPRVVLRRVLSSGTRTAANVRKRIGARVDEFVPVSDMDDLLGQVSSVVNILEPLSTSRSPLTVAKVVLGVMKFLIEDPTDGDLDDYFLYEDRGWTTAFEGDLAAIVYTCLRPKGELVRPGNSTSVAAWRKSARGEKEGPDLINADTCGAWTCTLSDGTELGWTVDYAGRVTALFVKELEKTSAKEAVLSMASDGFWAKHSTGHLVLRMKGAAGGDPYGEAPIGLVDEDSEPTHRSRLSDELLGLTRAYLNAGESQTIMLYGPPGSGKSTASRRLIQDLGVRSLRIPVEALSRLDVAALGTVFRVVRPDVVLMDDFDRCRDQAALLELVERLRAEVKVVLATVNDLDRLDEALLRPGRFDELVEVDRLDDDAIATILGEYSDALDSVRSWPVAFIQEYVRRRRVRRQSAEEARSSMVELAARVKRMRRKHRRSLSLDEELKILAPDPTSVASCCESDSGCVVDDASQEDVPEDEDSQ